MNLISDKIKFYTNIILSGAIASAPLLWYLYKKNVMGQTLFLTTSSIVILFIGRICLELAILIEINWVDTYVECKVKRANHYEDYAENDNVFNTNWYDYLLLDNFKFAHEVIAHLADRLLFMLSSSVASIIGCVLMISIFQYEVLPYFWVFIIVLSFVIFAFKKALSIATGLDFLRYTVLRRSEQIEGQGVDQ